jgi:glycosyltransferase involved in cell wall biosynthesis
MHIAMLSAEYPPRWGGMGSTVFHLSSALVSRGHEVTIITRNGGGAQIPIIDGIEVITVGWIRLPMEFTRSYGRSALRALKKLNQSKPIDVVHLHCPMISWSTQQFEDCKNNIAPVVSSLHGSWLGEKDGLVIATKQKESAVWANPNDLAILLTANRYARFENAAVINSNVCVANSEATKLDFLKRYSVPENWDCEVIHWGVDTEMFSPRESPDKDLRNRFGCTEKGILLLAVGRLAARKGYGSLLKAFAIVNSEVPESRLVIVGRGHLRSRLLKQAKKLGISSSVYIEPSLSFLELASLFRNADLTVYPSYYEGQGLIPLESMSSGTPVVTVNHGPLPEMVDSTVGALFTMGDIHSMSSTILEEIKNKKALNKKGIEGRKRVIEKFTYEMDADYFIKIYNRV